MLYIGAATAQIDSVGPPCASNCLYAVQGNLTLQNIATSTWTSFPELAILNDAKYVTSRPDQVYQPQTICVSATFCQAQSLLSSSYEDGPKPCDSGCQLISGPNSTFAKVAEELTAAAQSRNSQAAGIAPISLLDLNPASDYAGSFQTIISPVCAPYVSCRPELQCIVPINPMSTAAQLSSYTSTSLNQLSYLNANFAQRLNATALGPSLCVREGCEDVIAAGCNTGCAVALPHNTTYGQLQSALPFPKEADFLRNPSLNSGGNPDASNTSPWDSQLDYLNGNDLEGFLPTYNGQNETFQNYQNN
ncbi:hypothetical protein WJX84_010848 [Apatococcus fuscideae]|uniref:Uncharacterized protein n=1 Tax=Apatococcus fuscideae TaxID=2026836 RepID=A0AAW1SD09_9CHLO